MTTGIDLLGKSRTGDLTAELAATFRDDDVPFEREPIYVCPTCGGSGEVHRNLSRSIPKDPQMQEDQVCSTCSGTGAEA